jgi:hypothetical protein
MTPRLDLEDGRKTKLSEYVLRFLFGGAVTMGTGLVAHYFGPVVGGLFLAFPAILPASLTLVERHAGRDQVVEDAHGACLGALGLAAFALVVWHGAGTGNGSVVLAAATIAWMAVACGAWWLRYGRGGSGNAMDPRIHARSRNKTSTSLPGATHERSQAR